MALVPDVKADQKRGYLFQDASVFQFATINRAHAGNSCSQQSNHLTGFRIIAADDHIAFHRAVGVEKFGRDVLERGDHRYTLGSEFRGFLGGGASE